jgi:programmed cell death protein 5
MAYQEDPELAALRQRRLREIQEMQARAGGSEAMAAAQQSADAQRREAERFEVMRRLLTPEARERLARIRLAKPDMAAAIEQQIMSLAASGRLQRQVDDETLRALLERIAPERREIHITRR